MSVSPRKVRNFWIRAAIDGRKSILAGGPRSRDGGMSLTLFQRREGSALTSLEISCRSTSAGVLVVELVPHLPFYSGEEEPILWIETER